MKKEIYIKKMEDHHIAFNDLWKKIVIDTNKFVEENPSIGAGDFSLQSVASFIDDLSLSGAWVQDRINGLSGTYGLDGYKKSLSRKIRKSLGFTF